jgi:hypothetical protein
MDARNTVNMRPPSPFTDSDESLSPLLDKHTHNVMRTWVGVAEMDRDRIVRKLQKRLDEKTVHSFTLPRSLLSHIQFTGNVYDQWSDANLFVSCMFVVAWGVVQTPFLTNWLNMDEVEKADRIQMCSLSVHERLIGLHYKTLSIRSYKKLETFLSE